MSRLYRQLSSRELLNRVSLDQDAAHNLLQDGLLNDLLHDLDGDLDTALLARYASLNMTYVFRPGELLCWTRRCEAQALLVAMNVTGREQRWRLPAATGEVLAGHGFDHRMDAGELVLPPCQAFFAKIA